MDTIDAPRRSGSHDRAHGGRAASSGAPSGEIKLLYGVLALVLGAYAISLVVRGQNGPTWSWLDDWGPCVFELVVSALVLARGVLYERDRKYAMLLGAAGCFWAAGDFVQVMMGDSAPTLALFNFLWAAFYPLAYVGLMVLLERDVKKLTAANYLDGVIATLVVAAAIVAFAFHPIAVASGAGAESTGVNIVYPLGDLLLFGLTVFALMLLPRGGRMRWYLIAAAGIVNAAGDIAALFNGIVATDAGWFINVLAWPASLFLISAAVWLAPDPGTPVKDNTSSGFAVPTVASGFALLLVLVTSLGQGSKVALGFAVATLLVAGVRFGLALKRLNALNDERHRELEVVAQAERESKHALEIAVRSYAEFAARVADGDLTTTVAADAEELRQLGESLNTMVGGLSQISTGIQAGMEEIGSSAAEILQSVSQHTESASQQSAAITQTSATINELREAADETARRAQDVAERATDSARVSDEGSAAVVAIADVMQDIRTRVDAIAQEIVTLSERAQQIGAITDTVNELSGRSHLLALNATIEAARAGEHGRGFAVVADQVRQLAEQSRQATAQVEGILGDVRTATAAAVSVSEAGSQEVERGLELTARADEGIRSLTDTIRDAAAAAQEIAASASQQSERMGEIAQAMTGIEDGTTQFLEGVHASELAAENLNELSVKLAELTARYRVTSS
jgi:methyl-accepting chemotaxis protein